MLPATTKLVRASGRRVRLVDAPFGQPLGHREWGAVWGTYTDMNRSCHSFGDDDPNWARPAHFSDRVVDVFRDQLDHLAPTIPAVTTAPAG